MKKRKRMADAASSRYWIAEWVANSCKCTVGTFLAESHGHLKLYHGTMVVAVWYDGREAHTGFVIFDCWSTLVWFRVYWCNYIITWLAYDCFWTISWFGCLFQADVLNGAIDVDITLTKTFMNVILCPNCLAVKVTKHCSLLVLCDIVNIEVGLN